MSSRRTERLLNLVICLLATRRWLTKEQIRGAVPQYADCETNEAFDRMFERDKEDLRELGIPVVTGTDELVFDDELGYRIDRDAYALPPIQLDAEELAVLGLASRVWQQASLAGPAARALAKLTALGVDTDDAIPGLEPRIRTAEPSFEPLYAATRDRQPVKFAYRKPYDEAGERQVEPWAVLSRSGHWYVVGRDRDRDDARVFRLSRIEGDVRPIGRKGSYDVPDIDPRVMIAPRPADARVATVLIQPGRAASLRRRALPASQIGQLTGDARRSAVRAPEGWDELHFQIGDADRFADELAGYGPAVIAVAPADVRDGVRRRLAGALSAQSGPSLLTVTT